MGIEILSILGLVMFIIILMLVIKKYKAKQIKEVVVDKVVEVEKVENTKIKYKKKWYNNGEVQKLVLVDEIQDLDNSWVKGKLKSKSKK